MKLDRKSILRAFGTLSAALLSAQPALAQKATYPTVTDARLEHPDAGDWLIYRRTYDGSGFSPLEQITSSSVSHLTLAWSMSTDLLGAHETTAIVNHGRMFIAHVAVTAGWGLDAQGVQNGIDKIQGTKTVVPKGGTLLVFKLR